MQGFNMGRYVPPDAEGLLTANQASGKGHALGARAARLQADGVLTVRFEMPFAVWCDTCGSSQQDQKTPQPPKKPVLIGQGVRFNAEKKKIGTYYSSPVYSFRLRHPACGGVLEIHTDPKHTAYVVASGGRKRTEADPTDDDSLVPSSPFSVPTPQEQADARETAFATLEKTIADRAALAASKKRIDALARASARAWDDPYARNAALRATFRVGRRARARGAASDEALRDRLGFGIALLPESDEDARRARLVEFGTRAPSPSPPGEQQGGVGGGEAEKAVFARPLFGRCDAGGGGAAAGGVKSKSSSSNNGDGDTTNTNGRNNHGRAKKKPPKKLLKSEAVAFKRKETLVSEIMGNTRMATDPFLEPRSSRESAARAASPLLPGLKRKREEEPSSSTVTTAADKAPPAKVAAIVSSGLVDYDSD